MSDDLQHAVDLAGGDSPPYRTDTRVKRTSPPVGAKVYVADEKRPFVVRARDERFAVCTKRHFSTVRYTVLDAEAGIRGTENLVFGMGAETVTQCREMLARIASGDSEISHRNRVDWDVSRVVEAEAP